MIAVGAFQDNLSMSFYKQDCLGVGNPRGWQAVLCKSIAILAQLTLKAAWLWWRSALDMDKSGGINSVLQRQ